jgi:hypothetical protein
VHVFEDRVILEECTRAARSGLARMRAGVGSVASPRSLHRMCVSIIERMIQQEYERT